MEQQKHSSVHRHTFSDSDVQKMENLDDGKAQHDLFYKKQATEGE